jgi:hypothetical protein
MFEVRAQLTVGEQVSNAVSYRDAAQVFGKCVDVADDVPFLIVAGISKHDLCARNASYVPLLDSGSFENLAGVSATAIHIGMLLCTMLGHPN